MDSLKSVHPCHMIWLHVWVRTVFTLTLEPGKNFELHVHHLIIISLGGWNNVLPIYLSSACALPSKSFFFCQSSTFYYLQLITIQIVESLSTMHALAISLD
jgi:hypothetical protein